MRIEQKSVKNLNRSKLFAFRFLPAFWKNQNAKVFYLFFSLLSVFYVKATEYQPWLGNFYEFELRSSARYQGFAKISSGDRSRRYLSNDVFLNLSLGNAFPDPAYGVELEFTEARTRKQKGEVDCIKATGRFVWKDDLAGDTLSLTTGLSYIQAFRHSLKDESSFHHGLYNAELFASIGKEGVPEGDLWGSRWWSLFAIGIAERGSPWLRFYVNYEKRLWERHEIKTFCRLLFGVGGQRLPLHHFNGYGPICHRSIDLGLRYTYELECYGSASLEYSYRIYAQNFPIHTHQIYAQILYTFGL